MALSLFTVPLPRGWSKHVRSGALQALALAHFVATHVRGWCLESRITRVRLAAQRDIALSKVAALQEEARILRARIEHLCPQRQVPVPPVPVKDTTLRLSKTWPAKDI